MISVTSPLPAKFAKDPQSFLSTDVDGELILVQAETGAFFSLKDTGLAVWNALDGAGDMVSLRDEILAEYDVSPEECEHDIAQFIRQLVDAGFVHSV